MTGQRRLNKSLNVLDVAKQNAPKEFPGILGAQFKGQTLVEVPNRDGFVYVRLRSNYNEVIQAYNSNVSPVYGLPVTVTRDATANRYIIRGRDLGQYGNWGTTTYLPRHGAQHSFPDDNWGGDIVWVYDRQIVPLSVSPPSGSSGGDHVYVYPDVVYWAGSWLYAGAESSPNLLTYKPTTDEAILVLIYLDTSGNLGYITGSLFPVYNIYLSDIVPYLPALPNDAAIPLGAVRLVSGTSSISWNEIYDLRPTIGGYVISGSYGSNGARQSILTFPSDITVSNNPLRIYNKTGNSQTISQVFLAVDTAPTDASIIVDVHKDGTTIFTNQAHRPVIIGGANTGYTTDIDVSIWPEGSYLTAHIDQIGSGTAGSDLVVHIIHN